MSIGKQQANSGNRCGKNVLKFEEGEKILCYHGSLIYEAKCLKLSNVRSNDFLYLVHYSGWSKNWDEWVDSKRILKYTDENLKKQQELMILKKSEKSKKSKVVVKKEEAAKETNGTKRKKTSNETTNDSLNFNSDKTMPDEPIKKKICIIDIYSKHNLYLTNPNIKINIPLSLKEWLVDDFDAVMHQNKLAKIPASKTVTDILKEYSTFIIENQSFDPLFNEFTLDETVPGLLRYFNVMLGSQLLYKFERIQYSEILSLNKEMSDIYGTIHFLRLLEKLKQILLYAPLDASSLESFIALVNNILKYMDRFNDKLFSMDDYISAPPNYIRAAF